MQKPENPEKKYIKKKMYGWHVGRRRRNTVAIHVAGSAGPTGESVLGSTVEEVTGKRW